MIFFLKIRKISLKFPQDSNMVLVNEKDYSGCEDNKSSNHDLIMDDSIETSNEDSDMMKDKDDLKADGENSS